MYGNPDDIDASQADFGEVSATAAVACKLSLRAIVDDVAVPAWVGAWIVRRYVEAVQTGTPTDISFGLRTLEDKGRGLRYRAVRAEFSQCLKDGMAALQEAVPGATVGDLTMRLDVVRRRKWPVWRVHGCPASADPVDRHLFRALQIEAMSGIRLPEHKRRVAGVLGE